MKELENKLKLNIQLFAEDEGEQDPKNNEGDGQVQNSQEQKPLTFQELLDSNKEYQAEFDRRVNKGIDTAKTNWETEYKKQLEAEKTEAERLAKLTEEERIKEQLEAKDKRIAELEAKENARTLKDETIKIFTQKEIPIAYIDLFDFNNISADKIAEKVELLSNNLSKDKENWLNSVLKQNPPTQKNNGSSEKQLKTYEDFVKAVEKQD